MGVREGGKLSYSSFFLFEVRIRAIVITLRLFINIYCLKLIIFIFHVFIWFVHFFSFINFMI